ncbi:hypothetical protein AKI39_13090 [Bordetella sp. H567]|uniref:universal stress protein n=1 Tax=Bordetella sp. H567 TaxID=1697043 RepID=UPI00081CC974|nr:universal stress protein [Bordetella sp. H567]AOB31425.1 hypothetical protein AKI39_13090 [Bordetella sp. H567]
MTSILVPMDGSDNAIRALNYVIDHAKAYAPLTVQLLNVQIPILSGNVRLFIDAATVRRYHDEEGEAALAKARPFLERAGIPYNSHIKVGHVAETIASMADEHKCDQIVMGTRGLGAASGMWLGSVTRKTLSLAHVPVTVVK